MTLKVDPQALRATQPSFTSVADTITTAAAALASAISNEGECWGNDEIGQAFAENYTPGVDSGQQAVTGLATVMTQLGANLVTIATAFETQDTTTAGALGQTTGTA